jgi:hypothetical protein
MVIRSITKRLILPAGGGIVPGWDGQKPFQLMFIWLL